MYKVTRFLWSTNAKDISILYLIYGILAAIIGSVLSLMIRLELSGSHIIESNNFGQIYNVIITSHALIMIFYFIMPVTLGTFGNFLVPILIGSLDMAYPRVNALSFWLLAPSLVSPITSMILRQNCLSSDWNTENGRSII